MKAFYERGLAVVTAGVFAACAGPASAVGPALPAPGSSPEWSSGQIRNAFTFTFTTLDDAADPMFNRLLGINNEGHIVGYYGSGTPSDPSKGYILDRPYGPTDYRNIGYPGAEDTEPTCRNNKQTIVGFYAEKGQTRGFVETQSIWTDYRDPHAGRVTEILGLNDSDIAVGFYKAKTPPEINAFELNIATGQFKDIKPPHGKNAVATGINGAGDVVGYMTQASGNVVGFLRRDRVYTDFSYPGSQSTEFLGVTVRDEIVGFYVDSAGATHGFLLVSPLWNNKAWQSIDDPNGIGTTIVTGVNMSGDLVGYYVDDSSVTHGFMATPSR
jgi:hypothetical protein